MAKVAQGQLTIVDLYDMPPVQGRLSSNKAKVFVETENGTINPTLSAGDPLLVSVEMYQAGSSQNIVQNPDPSLGTVTKIDWVFTTENRQYLSTNSGDVTALQALGVTIESPGGVTNRQIKITKNDILNPFLKIEAKASYRYTGMSETTTVGMDIDFSTIYSGTDGEDAFTVYLTNTTHIFPVDSANGTIIAGTSVTTTAEAYQGIKKLAGVKIKLKAGFNDPRFNITGADGSIDTATITTTSGVRVYGVSDTDQGTIPFEVLVPGVATPFDHTFSWSVSSRGVDGESSTSYWLDVSESAIIKSFNSSGALQVTPSTITLIAMKQIGETNPINWTSTATIKVSKNGGAATTVSNGTYAVATDTTSLKFELYYNSVLVDTETIRVIQEQKAPIVMTLHADTDTIRNEGNNAIITATVYKNGTDVTSSATKKWYQGGTVISGQTGNTLTVTPAMVATSELFKCEATIEGSTYFDTMAIYDISDPIVVEMRSSGGDKFQNGQGQSIVEAILWRNGAEIDAGGTQFTYTWKKLNKDGSLVAFTPTKEPTTATTFKKIKITNSDVETKATFICEIS